MSEAYLQFLRAKVCVADQWGFEIEPSEVNPALKPFQRDAVIWAAAGGRRALFESFGLGKSCQQLELVRLILTRTGGRGLIVTHLGVRQEFQHDAQHVLGWADAPRFIRSISEADDTGIYLTNYETIRDGKLDPRHFQVVSLDEGDILRGFGGTKTFRECMRLFAGDGKSLNKRERSGGVPYRFVATATPSPNDYIELLAYAAFLGVMEVSDGKAQPLDARVLTPNGWTTMGMIRVGDLVIAGDGSPARVIGVQPQGERPIFRVNFTDGASTECDMEHLWFTLTQYERNASSKYRLGTGRTTARRLRQCDYGNVRTTAEIAATLKGGHGENNHSIPVVGAVRFEEKPVPLDPYLLGAIIGDGCIRSTSVVITSCDKWILDRVERSIELMGLKLRPTGSTAISFGVTGTGKKGGKGPGSNKLLLALRALSLTGKRSYEKSIPEPYLHNTFDVRLELLRGLMDTDGTVSKSGQIVFSSTSQKLSRDVTELVRSLGGIATVVRKTCSYRSKKTGDRVPCRDCFCVDICLPSGINPFSLPRKADRVRLRQPPRRYITSVEAVGIKPAQCIAIEHKSRLYVTDDYLVTHNSRFFKRDSTKADNLRLLPHREREFWMWVSSWALFLQRPSDLNAEYSDAGYELPPLEVRWHEIETDHAGAGTERDGQGRLFRNAALGIVESSRERRDSLSARIQKMLEIRDETPEDHYLLWHDLEAEREAIEAAIPGVATVYGSQELDEREEIVVAFKNGEIPDLGAKPIMLGSGTNLQRHCHRAIYIGIGWKFKDFIQSVHRLQRFGQPSPVRIDLIYTEAERDIRADLERKWSQHTTMVAKMTDIIREHGLSNASMVNALTRTLGLERVSSKGENYELVNNDCVLETQRMESDSVHLLLTSVPFATQYSYSPSFNDFGHTDTNDHFFRQMDFLTPELLRVLKPGRLAAIHVKDRIVPGGMTGMGFQVVYPFHARCIEHFTKHGFAYMGMKTIVTDVVRENNQTYRLGWTEQCKDGTKMGVGMPEYLLIFRKPPSSTDKSYADQPVVKSKERYSRSRWQVDAHGFTRSSGNRPITAEDLAGMKHDEIFRLFRDYSLQNVYDFEHHVKLGESLEASGRLPVTFMLLQPPSWHPDVWSDVARMLTLNNAQSAKGREQHLCPLPLDIVDRAIEQWSMPGELVYDPFSGLGSVPYRAVLKGRRGLGVELSRAYWLDSAAYCKAAELEMAMPDLFSAMQLESAGDAA